METIAVDLIRLGSVGLIAGLFSSFLANRDYRQRKWWELRVAAYQNAIEALSDVVYFYERHFNAEARGKELEKSFSIELDNYWDEAFPKIRKLADSGAFLFSKKANHALKIFMDENTEYLSYVEQLDGNLGKAKQCLASLVECSVIDLELCRFRWHI